MPPMAIPDGPWSSGCPRWLDAVLGFALRRAAGIPPVMGFASAEMEQVEWNRSPDGGTEPVDLKAVMLKLINFSLAIRVILILIMERACW